jgi:hypothetical protein
VPRCGSPRFARPHGAEKVGPGCLLAWSLRAGRSAFAEAFPLNTVGALVEFVCDVEQIVAQQSASHSPGGILDELGSLPVFLRRQMIWVVIVSRTRSTGAKLWGLRPPPLGGPAPLPAGAQFLNVIESVFSGMARAVNANSNY